MGVERESRRKREQKGNRRETEKGRERRKGKDKHSRLGSQQLLIILFGSTQSCLLEPSAALLTRDPERLV